MVPDPCPISKRAAPQDDKSPSDSHGKGMLPSVVAQYSRFIHLCEINNGFSRTPEPSLYGNYRQNQGEGGELPTFLNIPARVMRGPFSRDCLHQESQAPCMAQVHTWMQTRSSFRHTALLSFCEICSGSCDQTAEMVALIFS